MPSDIYVQPEAPDPVLSETVVLALVRAHVPAAHAVTGVDESGGEARTYAVDEAVILKVQRPPQLRPRTSLAKEAWFLRRLAEEPGIAVPRVLGYGRQGSGPTAIEYTVLTRMPGIALRHAPLDAPARPAALRALGQTLRRIHGLPQAPFQQSGLIPGDGDWAAVQARLEELRQLALEPIAPDAPIPGTATTVEALGRRALAALPARGARVALHSNPGPEHTFVDPATGAYQGLIDFGDAYISHPAFDLRRWRAPADRAALFAGYTAAAPVDDDFLATWRVVQVLTDLVVLAHYPDRAAEAVAEIQHLLPDL
ncbi:MAG TPA: aminoglycoside phosphotransferase family protein [Chloroflexia bacterium]|nr:aminoglycoside phosphotransferase family protein [Chloroflexia bacterium]